MIVQKLFCNKERFKDCLSLVIVLQNWFMEYLQYGIFLSSEHSSDNYQRFNQFIRINSDLHDTHFQNVKKFSQTMKNRQLTNEEMHEV